MSEQNYPLVSDDTPIKSQAALRFTAKDVMPEELRGVMRSRVPMLGPLRAFRDHRRDSLALWADGHEEHFERMTMRDGGFAKALDYFQGNHLWSLCEECEKFEACCALVAEIETFEYERQKARVA